MSSDKQYKKWTVSHNELAQGFRGEPFGKLILHHVERQSLRQIKKELFATIGFLPNELQQASESWIDLNNSYAVDEKFWRADCGDVLLSVVERAKDFSERRGISADNDTALNLFQIVVLTFAYTAHCEKRSKEFIQRAVGIEKTNIGLFGRLFGQ